MEKQKNTDLLKARLTKMWTIEQAAAKAEVNRSTYLRWENGRQLPHLTSLKRLCDALQASPEELGFGDLVQNTTFSSRASQEQTQQSSEQERTDEHQEQKLQTLFNVVKNILPVYFHTYLHPVKMQLSQQTLHVSCDVGLDKNTTGEIKRRFREMTGWSLGIQVEHPQQANKQEEGQLLYEQAKSLFPDHIPLYSTRMQLSQQTFHISCGASLDKNTAGEIKRRFREMTGWSLGIHQETQSRQK
jgi:transcriptional regulator with XRE-family HTH domain